MATWTSPITWTTGAVTAAQFNQQIRDNETWLKGAFTQLGVTSDAAKAKITPALVGARVTKSALQTISNNTLTPINFDAETFDSDAFHSTSVNNTRITIPASMGGYYIVGADCAYETNGTGNRRVQVVLGGVTTITIDTRSAFASQACHISISTLHQFTAGEYFETWAFQTSGGNLDVSALSDYSPIMYIHRLSST